MKRHIKILIKDSNKGEIERIKDYCNENDLHFEYRYERYNHLMQFKRSIKDDEREIAPLFYFIVYTDTEGFNKLNKEFDNKLILTDFSEVCNIADLDDSFEEDLVSHLENMKKIENLRRKGDSDFLHFIKPFTNISLLEFISKNYSAYMSNSQKDIIRNRIDILKGDREKIDEEFTSSIYSLSADIKELRAKTGMNRTEFCKYFNIPYRTVEDWENKKSSCAIYLYDLMKKDLIRNNIIKEE